MSVCTKIIVNVLKLKFKVKINMVKFPCIKKVVYLT